MWNRIKNFITKFFSSKTKSEDQSQIPPANSELDATTTNAPTVSATIVSATIVSAQIVSATTVSATTVSAQIVSAPTVFGSFKPPKKLEGENNLEQTTDSLLNQIDRALRAQKQKSSGQKLPEVQQATTLPYPPSSPIEDYASQPHSVQEGTPLKSILGESGGKRKPVRGSVSYAPEEEKESQSHPGPVSYVKEDKESQPHSPNSNPVVISSAPPSTFPAKLPKASPNARSKEAPQNGQQPTKMTTSEILELMENEGFKFMNREPQRPPLYQPPSHQPPLQQSPTQVTEKSKERRGETTEKREKRQNHSTPTRSIYFAERKIPNSVYVKKRSEELKKIVFSSFRKLFNKTKETVRDPIGFVEEIGIIPTKYQQELDQKAIEKMIERNRKGNASHEEHANRPPARQDRSTKEAQKTLDESRRRSTIEKEQPVNTRRYSLHPPITGKKPIGLYTDEEYKAYQEQKKPPQRNLTPTRAR